MGKNLKFIIGLTIFILIFLVIGGYAYLKSREFISGPKITINTPADGSSFPEALITIEGIAGNISRITLNDTPIFVDSEGRFSEKMLLLQGYNIISIKAEDRFGKNIEKTLELVYKMPVFEDNSASSTLPIGGDIIQMQ
jgi:hypothetical protein